MCFFRSLNLVGARRTARRTRSVNRKRPVARRAAKLGGLRRELADVDLLLIDVAAAGFEGAIP
jgi:hypothetical protein